MEKSVFIISGEVGEGKTTYLISLLNLLIKKNIKIAGFFAPRIIENQINKGFYIIDIKSKICKTLCIKQKNDKYIHLCNFYFNPLAIEFGKNLINTENVVNDDLIVIDEVGIFELDGQIWGNSIDVLCEQKCKNLILIVRKNLIDKVLAKWRIANFFIINVNSEKPEKIANLLIEKLKIP